MSCFSPLLQQSALATACLAVGLAAAASARTAPPTAPPPAVHADTEASTNVPFAAPPGAPGRISFALSCRATPSNNAEVAFGADADGDGVLAPEEVAFVVGWDCGAWFTRRGADGAYAAAAASDATGGVRTLSWEVRVGADGRAARLAAPAEGGGAFAGRAPGEVYSPSWNLLRLTGRGTGRPFESFRAAAAPDGMVFTVR